MSAAPTWIEAHAIAKRAFQCGAIGVIEAFKALEQLGYGAESRCKEVLGLGA